MEAVNFKVDSLNVDSSSVVGLRPETIRTVRDGGASDGHLDLCTVPDFCGPVEYGAS